MSKVVPTRSKSFHEKDNESGIATRETRIDDSREKPDGQPTQIPFYLKSNDTPVTSSKSWLHESLQSPSQKLRSSTNGFALDNGLGLNFTNLTTTGKIGDSGNASDPEIGLGVGFMEIKRVITSVGSLDGVSNTRNIDIGETGGEESLALQENALAKKLEASLTQLE